MHHHRHHHVAEYPLREGCTLLPLDSSAGVPINLIATSSALVTSRGASRSYSAHCPVASSSARRSAPIRSTTLPARRCSDGDFGPAWYSPPDSARHRPRMPPVLPDSACLPPGCRRVRHRGCPVGPKQPCCRTRRQDSAANRHVTSLIRLRTHSMW